MSEKWTKLAEYMRKMEEELGNPDYFSKNPIEEEDEREKKARQRSAKYLWLA